MALEAPEPRRCASTMAPACPRCLRRSWLLGALGGALDKVHGDHARLLDALALDDEQLIQAVGGRRRSELQAAHADFAADTLARRDRVEAVCIHDRRFPDALRFAWGPRALHVAHSAARLDALTRQPIVAIVGSPRASDYGLEVARSLAGNLAAVRVTVASSYEQGIDRAALIAAAQSDGATVCALAGGLAGGGASAHERLTRRGCLVSELPCDTPARRWGALAGQRVIAGLASLTVVVEAQHNARELAPARLAARLERTVAAVPGRVTSPLAAGPNALLARGARVVRDAADALELLFGEGGRGPADQAPRAPALQPRLRDMLARVSTGVDTLDQLVCEGAVLSEVLCTISELELMGLLVRGDGGRYVARRSLAWPRERPEGPRWGGA